MGGGLSSSYPTLPGGLRHTASFEWLSQYGGFGEGDVSGAASGPTSTAPVRERPRGGLPSPGVRSSLEVLCADSRNTVIVMSTGSTDALSTA